MKGFLLLAGLALLFAAHTGVAQGQYDDVAVIVNLNSPASVAIGEYFRVQRNIPAANMIYVNTDTSEEIDATRFNALRTQVEQQLVANNLVNTVNYLVTTKGMPLKVNRGNIGTMSSPSSSVESDFTLLLGPNSGSIGASGYVISPYFYSTAHFSRAAFGIFLVTRLDGYTTQEVFDLINRSGPNVSVPQTARVVLDQDPIWYDLRYLNEFMATARDTLVARNRTVELDTTTTYLTYRTNVLGYVSWGSNDHNAAQYSQYAIPHNTYVPGALAETFVSTSGRSFVNPPSYGQSLIADLVHEGVSCVKGYVYEPYSLAMARANVLFDRYTAGFNMAESFYAASIFLSWMDVVVGDPKTSLSGSPRPLPVQLVSFTGSLIPQTTSIQFNWRTVSEVNNYGFYMQRADVGSSNFTDVPNSFVPGHGTTIVPQNYAWRYENAPANSSRYRLRQVDLDGTLNYSEPILVTNNVTSVEQEGVPRKFELGQNYPNPFNPSTEIRFSVEQTGPAKLTVYNAVGQQVTTLFDAVAEAGTRHAVQFTASGLASGVYYYRLESGRQHDVKKFVLVK